MNSLGNVLCAQYALDELFLAGDLALCAATYDLALCLARQVPYSQHSVLLQVGPPQLNRVYLFALYSFNFRYYFDFRHYFIFYFFIFLFEVHYDLSLTYRGST